MTKECLSLKMENQEHKITFAAIELLGPFIRRQISEVTKEKICQRRFIWLFGYIFLFVVSDQKKSLWSRPHNYIVANPYQDVSFHANLSKNKNMKDRISSLRLSKQSTIN